MTYLPQPEVPGPNPGAPGHYAHHEWLEASLRALDDFMTMRGWLLVLGPQSGQSVLAGTYSPVKMGEALAEIGTWDYDRTIPGRSLQCGDSWAPGYYRVDYSGGMSGVENPVKDRSVRLMVNGSSPETAPKFVQTGSTGLSGRPWAAAGGTIVHLKPGDYLNLEMRQGASSAATVDEGGTRMVVTLHNLQAAP